MIDEKGLKRIAQRVKTLLVNKDCDSGTVFSIFLKNCTTNTSKIHLKHQVFQKIQATDYLLQKILGYCRVHAGKKKRFLY